MTENRDTPLSPLVVGIYGSPRKEGNTDILLDTVLSAMDPERVRIERVYVRELKMKGCIECGKCDDTGVCALKDQMEGIYPLLESANIVLLASPIFFYGISWQAKALVDRAQALWSKKRLGLLKKREGYSGGYLLAVGATKGKNLFLGVELVAKYFYDALDLPYQGGLFYRSIEKKGEILERKDILKEAIGLGRQISGLLKV